tara:strand:+ start:548 stop:916 length:369 start_codon:yes stop_codon:yes gene_type:complete
MPTKKRRVGFIPRGDVLDLIDKLSLENNLSNSKIINILVEEALYKRGILNIKTGKIINTKQNNLENDHLIKIGSLNKDFAIDFKNNENTIVKEAKEDILDKEIYSKFIMFLQFQEKMKKNDK